MRAQLGTQKRLLCHLQVIVDHVLYNYYRRNSDDASAKAYLTNIVASHVNTATTIYSSTDFGGIVGIKFIVQSLKINSTSCEPPEASQNPFCSDDIDASVMLQLLSFENHNDFCLTYVLTNRDFSFGTLGLAYLAYPDDPGGICGKHQTVHTRGGPRKMSLNTGIITFQNHGSQVSPKVSEITLAHELGHSFGSPHDETLECTPGDPEGNYIMFDQATSARLPNNRKFSKCSIASIAQVLHVVNESLHDKENCFLENKGPFCGNNIREDTEECDCGYGEVDCRERCCYPRKNQANAQGCTLKPSTQCSPSSGSCCGDDCRFINRRHVCALENDCNSAVNCNGLSAECPAQTKKANLTRCNKGSQVCIDGSCEGSLCLLHGYEDCQSSGPSYSAEKLCNVFCKLTAGDKACVDPCEEPKLQLLCGVARPRGAPCNGNMGYCDVYKRCRAVNEGGALRRLQSIFFGTGRISRWIQRTGDRSVATPWLKETRRATAVTLNRNATTSAAMLARTTTTRKAARSNQTPNAAQQQAHVAL
ncbi:disintegrin and metalloproteinase domain-containing protein 10 [Ixodes scapularis]|uniref:disintegrin and metalloproteinase domain-containing protein 10 n=1 Tax=Ixodes scapularis TaxID=6945 RepID=UPI001C382659|nr:disintegrin and metalloproteinase domain-containing protein 10 [Ixodes scapularis]